MGVAWGEGRDARCLLLPDPYVEWGNQDWARVMGWGLGADNEVRISRPAVLLSSRFVAAFVWALLVAWEDGSRCL